MNAHEKFEAKCTSLLLEGRLQTGEFASKKDAWISYEKKLKDYYKKEALKADLFTENNDYKLLYFCELRHNKRLKKIISVDKFDMAQDIEAMSDIICEQSEQLKELHEIIETQANEILRLKEIEDILTEENDRLGKLPGLTIDLFNQFLEQRNK